jgi:hypothetical protein
VLNVGSNIALNKTYVYTKERGLLKISGLKEGTTKVKLYCLLGKQVFTTKFEARAGVKDISLPDLSRGFYLAELQTKEEN